MKILTKMLQFGKVKCMYTFLEVEVKKGDMFREDPTYDFRSSAKIVSLGPAIIREVVE